MLNDKGNEFGSPESKQPARGRAPPTKEELSGYKMVNLLENRKQLAEDSHPCDYCTDFLYFSMVKCKRCVKQYCIWHKF